MLISNNKDRVILYSHGFGVKQDSKGLLTDIAAGLPGYDHLLFDYCNIAENGDTYLESLQDQRSKFDAAWKIVLEKGYKEINILTHSFGIVIPMQFNSSLVNKLVVLAPPVAIGRADQLERLQAKPGATIDLKGYSIRPRSDGTKTFVHYSFYDSLDGLDFYKDFDKLLAREVTVIIPKEEEILPHNFESSKTTKQVKLLEIPGDHNFTGRARPGLIKALQTIFSY